MEVRGSPQPGSLPARLPGLLEVVEPSLLRGDFAVPLPAEPGPVADAALVVGTHDRKDLVGLRLGRGVGKPEHPRVAIIGKGVCFDSGGLDIKPSSAMRLMKKDMGGAAHALALAQLIMVSRLPVRLHLLIPAVENAIAGNAFRPGDVLSLDGDDYLIEREK